VGRNYTDVFKNFPLLVGSIFMLLCDAALAKEFRVPGQELWGTWRVKSHDLREFPQPWSEVLRKEIEFGGLFQPVGQQIEITYDGTYVTSGMVRGGTDKYPHPVVPHLAIAILPPLSNSLCEFDAWSAYCKDGKISITTDFKNGIYWGYAAVFNRRAAKRRTQWAGAASNEYFLWGEQFRCFARMLKKDQLLVMHMSGGYSLNDTPPPVVYSIWERTAAEKKGTK
jgi:hypothetical protein